MDLKDYLNDMGKTKDDILLINPYKKTNAITRKLALETLSKENFCTNLLTPEKTSAHEAATASQSLERTLRMSARPPTH